MSQQDETVETIRRRELLRRAAWILGGAISAPAALAILQGCSAKEAATAVAPSSLKRLKPGEFDVVAEIVDIMIPKTDTAGAKEVGVPAFIDVALDAVYDAESQDRFTKGCAEFLVAAKQGGKDFLEQDRAARTEFVKTSLSQALTQAQAGDRKQPKPFILMTRELALLGYFTTQPGITQNMTYEAVPTAYHGCVPIAQMKTPAYWE
ncbi:MAG TPA: gluconate 2-dehydrogenase subunit 3 family protein [Steroidobacteraceae bacterium]|nr:gluconate 2-dehydrogenase subunit 3 family protein [Steroidobacteraceae bacterium]